MIGPPYKGDTPPRSAFSAIEWFTITFKGRPTRVASVRLDRDRDEQGLQELVGSELLIDGAPYTCIGVERFAHGPPWREGEHIGLAVQAR